LACVAVCIALSSQLLGISEFIIESINSKKVLLEIAVGAVISVR
jgi:hypothetical protein